MVIVVVTHDAGWRYHVVVEGPTQELSLDHDRVIVAATERASRHVGEYTLAFERYDDPVEHALLVATDDASATVYADWLDQHAGADRATYLRTQRACLALDPASEAFAAASQQLRDLVPALPYGWRSHVTRAVIVLGDPATFEIRIGLADLPSPSQRVVQLWSGGEHLTHVDDTVYVPQFAMSLVHELRTVSGARTSHRIPWLRCGPTTDNLTAWIVRDGDDVLLAFELIRLGRRVTTRLPLRDLLALLEQTAAILR